MHTPLDQTRNDHPGKQRAHDRATAASHSLSLLHGTTGFSALDRLLPGGGWPLCALTEIHHDRPSIGELRLLMPTLARLSRQGRWVAIIAPPYIPCAPALATFGLDLSRVLLVHPRSRQDGLAALERGLRSGTCGAVIAWAKQVDSDTMQRLQTAAKTGKTWGILFRDSTCQDESTAAALRLRLEERRGQTTVHVLDGQSAEDKKLTLDLSRHASLQPASRSSIDSGPAPRRNQDATARIRPPVRPQLKPAAHHQELPPQLELPLPPPPDRRSPDSRDKPGAPLWR